MRKILKYGVFCLICMMLMTSCNKNDLSGFFVPSSESVDKRFSMSMRYNEENGFDTIMVDSDDYLLYMMTDVHIENSTENLDRYVADYLADTMAAKFSLCLGDLIYGKNRFDSFVQQVKPVADAGRKIYYTVGNHDLYFGQWNDFYDRFGSSTYWFVVQTPGGFKDLYVSLDSGSGTLGVDQRNWLEDVLNEKQNEGFRHIIVYTHTHFFRTNGSPCITGSFAMEETYDLADLFDRYDVTMVLQGHSHYRDLTVFKGVTYLRLDAMKEGSDEAYYTVLQVGDNVIPSFREVN